MKSVYILMCLGGGDCEDAWEVSSVHETQASANARMEELQPEDNDCFRIDEWPLSI